MGIWALILKLNARTSSLACLHKCPSASVAMCHSQGNNTISTGDSCQAQTGFVSRAFKTQWCERSFLVRCSWENTHHIMPICMCSST